MDLLVPEQSLINDHYLGYYSCLQLLINLTIRIKKMYRIKTLLKVRVLILI